MSTRIQLDHDRRAYDHRESIRGHIEWELGDAPDWIELRLLWFTEGKGTQDVEVTTRERVEGSGATGTRAFDLTAPAHPPACSGRLVSIRWALELVTSGPDQVARVDLVIAPGGREILLGSAE